MRTLYKPEEAFYSSAKWMSVFGGVALAADWRSTWPLDAKMSSITSPCMAPKDHLSGFASALSWMSSYSSRDSLPACPTFGCLYIGVTRVGTPKIVIWNIHSKANQTTLCIIADFLKVRVGLHYGGGVILRVTIESIVCGENCRPIKWTRWIYGMHFGEGKFCSWVFKYGVCFTIASMVIVWNQKYFWKFSYIIIIVKWNLKTF